MESVAPIDEHQILFLKNLPYDVQGEKLYELFGPFGRIRQVRLGTEKKTRGTGFVVYDSVNDARAAQDKLSGYNLQGRYLVVDFFKSAASGS